MCIIDIFGANAHGREVIFIILSSYIKFIVAKNLSRKIIIINHKKIIYINYGAAYLLFDRVGENTSDNGDRFG